MSKRFRTCSLEQPFLLPPSLQEWLPEHHLARFVADVAAQLDLSEIYAHYQRQDGRGLAAYHPEMLTRLLLYAYAVGEPSSRRIEQATYDDVAFRYLAADQHPDHDTIASFRQQHLESLGRLFVQTLRLCQKAGLVKLGHVAIDGTKLEANASRRRSMSYAQLGEQERYWKEKVDEMLRRAAEADEAEDRRWGQGQPADPLPAELARAQSRLERLQQAKRELEQEARQKLEQAERDPAGREPEPPRQSDEARLRATQAEKQKKRRYRARRQAECPQRAQNLTDPDSRRMRDNGRGSIVQGYNAQLAVDAQVQVIVAAEVTQEVVDCGQLVPMMEHTAHNAGQPAEAVTADAGYWDTEAVQQAIRAGVHVLVSPDGAGARQAGRWRHMPNNPLAQRMRAELATETGSALYRLRQAIVEPVIGQIKNVRGFRRFALRRLSGVRAEWRIICLTHNLLKLFRYAWHPAAA